MLSVAFLRACGFVKHGPYCKAFDQDAASPEKIVWTLCGVDLPSVGFSTKAEVLNPLHWQDGWPGRWYGDRSG